MGYFSQINLIKREKSVGNFSLDVCAILLFANILRICFWFIFFLENIRANNNFTFKVWRKICSFFIVSIYNNDFYSGINLIYLRKVMNIKDLFIEYRIEI